MQARTALMAVLFLSALLAVPSAGAVELEASTFLGGLGSDAIIDMVRAPDGGVVVTGRTGAANFPTTEGAFQRGGVAGMPTNDAFVTKFSADLSTIEWSTRLGGSGEEHARALAVRPNGGVIVIGETNSEDFPLTDGALRTDQVVGDLDVFVTELEPDGSALRFSTRLGGDSPEIGFDLELAEDGSLYVVGMTGSVDFPVTDGAHLTEVTDPHCFAQGYVTRLAQDGESILASSFFGDGVGTLIEAAALTDDGAILLTGVAMTNAFPTTVGAWRETSSRGAQGNPEAFAARMDANLTAVAYSTWLGEGRNEGWAIVADGRGRAIVGGIGFAPGSGSHDGWVLRLSADGSDLDWGTWIGGSNADNVLDLALDEGCNVYVAGGAYSRGYAFSEDVIGRLGIGNDQGGMVAVLSPNGELVHADLLTGGPNGEHAQAVHVDAHGRFIAAGSTTDPAYPTTDDAAQGSSAGEMEGFVSELSADIPPTDEDCGEEIIPHGGDSLIPGGELLRESFQRRGLRIPISLQGRDRRSPQQ